MHEESVEERQKRRAKRRAREWCEANEDCKRAEQARDEALWACLEDTVHYVERSNFKTPAQVNSAVQEINPQLDSRARSRYTKIVYEAVGARPKDVRLKDWVKSRGGIARFRKPRRR